MIHDLNRALAVAERTTIGRRMVGLVAVDTLGMAGAAEPEPDRLAVIGRHLMVCMGMVAARTRDVHHTLSVPFVEQSLILELLELAGQAVSCMDMTAVALGEEWPLTDSVEKPLTGRSERIGVIAAEDMFVAAVRHKKACTARTMAH